MLRTAIAAVVAGVFVWIAKPLVAAILFSATVIVSLAVLVLPPAVSRALERFERALARAVSTVLALVLLAPVFFLFFVPFRLSFRRGARDRLQRRFDRAAATYWRRRDERPLPLDRPY